MPSHTALFALLLSACCLTLPLAQAAPAAAHPAAQPLLSSSSNDFSNDDWDRGVLRRVSGLTISAMPEW